MPNDFENGKSFASLPDERGEEDPAVLTEAADQIAILTAERDRLVGENAELNDRLLRRAAEFDNFRRRSDKERLEILEYAAMDAVKAMLPFLDDLERALKTMTPDKEYARGLELIYQRMFEALRKLGLEPIEAEGKPFDPNLHHAVEMVSTTEVPDHNVLTDLQRGYNFKGRLLRASMVRVAVTPE
jgi:molecular chaperone GrpE